MSFFPDYSKNRMLRKINKKILISDHLIILIFINDVKKIT